MKRIVLALSVWLCLCSAALGRTRIQGYCDASGVTLTTGGLNASQPSRVSYPGCTVTAYLTGTTIIPVIYADDAGTTKANPFTADGTTGAWFFYSDAAIVDVRFSGATIPVPFTQAVNTIISQGYDVTVNPLTALSVNVSAGVAMCPAEVTYVGGTFSSLTVSTDNYLYLNTGSLCAPAVVATTGFPIGSIPVAEVFTNGLAVTNIISRIGIPSGANIQVNGSSVPSVNLNGTVPSAPSCSENVGWGVSGSSVSASLLLNVGG